VAPGRAVRLEHTADDEPAARFYAGHAFVELRREPAGSPGWPDQFLLVRPLADPAAR
jgi:hypothetical protein